MIKLRMLVGWLYLLISIVSSMSYTFLIKEDYLMIISILMWILGVPILLSNWHDIRKVVGEVWRYIAQEKWEFVSLFETLGLLLFRAFVLITVLDHVYDQGLSLIFRLWIAVGGFLWMFKSGAGSTRKLVQDIQLAHKNAEKDDGY